MTAVLDDLSERLLTHFVGGAWRAPLGTQTVPVHGRAGLLGQVVLAGPADLARAERTRRAADAASVVRLHHALADQADNLADAISRVWGTPIQIKALAGILDVVKAADLTRTGLIWHPDPQDILPAMAVGRLAHQTGLPPGALAILPRIR